LEELKALANGEGRTVKEVLDEALDSYLKERRVNPKGKD
jgi:hypothetical protein